MMKYKCQLHELFFFSDCSCCPCYVNSTKLCYLQTWEGKGNTHLMLFSSFWQGSVAYYWIHLQKASCKRNREGEALHEGPVSSRMGEG